MTNETGSHGGVGVPIDQNESTELARVRIGLERQRLRGCNVADGDVVEFELACGLFGERVHVDAVLDCRDRGSRPLAREFHIIATTCKTRLFVQPDQRSFELISRFDRRIRAA